MSNPDIRYVHEKVGNAVRQLATSDDPLRKRLEAAFFKMWALKDDDFSDEDSRKLYAEIRAQLRAVPGSNQNTRDSLAQMGDQSLEELAHLYVSLYGRVVAERMRQGK